MAKPEVRLTVVAAAFAVGIAVLVARAAQVQLVNGADYATQAASQRTETVVLPARRGALYDRNAVPVAVTQESFHVGLAPNLTWEGVRGERYVYARYIDQEPVYEFLHDLEKDIDQLTNFVDNPAYREVLATMRRRCDELAGHYGGPMLPVEERYSKQQPKKRKSGNSRE